jgi:Flp pilus assembly protein TadD
MATRGPRLLLALAATIVVALGVASHAPAALAQAGANSPPPALPPEYSQASRDAFAAAMKEARSLLAQKRYDEAIAKLDDLSRDRPREPQARFLRGVAQTELGRDDDAIKTYEGLTSDFPELPEPHNNLAALYAKKGNLELARRELELAIAADPDYGIANENLGDVYVRLATQQYERAATLAKNSKTLPAKLKLVRDVLATKPDATAAAGTPATSPGAATPAKPETPPTTTTPATPPPAPGTPSPNATKEKSP